jgi:DNA polymerase-1
MLAAQLLEASADKGPRPSYKLEHVAQRLAGVEMDKTLQRSDWSGDLSQEQLTYAARDAAVLLPLYDRLVDELTTAGLISVLLLEIEALPAVVWLEQSGAPFDAAAWRALSDGAMAEQIQLECDLAEALGAADLFGPRGIKWSSASQVLRLMRERGHDVERVDEDTLQDLALRGEQLAPLLLRYRDACKRVGTYGIAYLRHVHSVTQRIHAGYRQLGSQAGRMSCTGPNLQQVPRARAYRACFRPPSGRVLVKADLSQIELRAVAQVAPEPHMLAAFERGEDLHALTARRVLPATSTGSSSRRRRRTRQRGPSSRRTRGSTHGIGTYLQAPLTRAHSRAAGGWA